MTVSLLFQKLRLPLSATATNWAFLHHSPTTVAVAKFCMAGPVSSQLLQIVF